MSLKFLKGTRHTIGKLTATQPSYTTSFTTMGWFWLSVDSNAVVTFFYAHDDAADTNWIGFDTAADGTQLSLDTIGGTVGGSQLTLNKWYHICLTKSGTAFILYLNGIVDATSTDATSFASIDSYYFMGFKSGAGLSSYTPSGRVAAMKMWSGVALTRDEIRAEMRQFAPVRQASLYAYYPGWDVPGYLVDRSGRGNHLSLLSVATAPTQEYNPYIPWEVMRPRNRYVPAAAPPGTGSGMLLGGVRNYLVREAY